METLDPRMMVRELLRRGYSQQALAEKAGVSQSAISKIANGAVRNPAYNTITALIPLLSESEPPAGRDKCRK